MQHNIGAIVYNVQVEPGTVRGQLLKRVSGGASAYMRRTSTNDRIDAYVCDVYTHNGSSMATVAMGNCLAKWKGGNAVENIIYEDITNPAEVTTTTGGRRIGVIMGGGVYNGFDDIRLECFTNDDPGYYDYISTPALLNGNGTWQVYDNTLPSFTIYKKSLVIVSYYIEINKSGFANGGINASGVYFNPANASYPEARFDIGGSYDRAVVPDFANQAWDYVRTCSIVLEAGTYSPGIVWYQNAAGNFVQASPHQRVNIAWN